ncbi:MAG: sugar transferase [Opitutae bacterium]|nr:sugar transferase [Opitutae bacterium]
MNPIYTNQHFVARRYLTVAHPWGRRLLSFQSACERGAWRLQLASDEFAKRAFDCAASALALLLISPLWALIALLIKLEDGGPVVFAQTRVGKHGREFKMFKFRSMRADAEQRLQDLLAKNHHQTGVTFKIKDDPRITRVGRWLRKFSFDELPQFANVLAGDMSLVGPRPPLPREVALYTLADRRRLLVRPGITCLWQISGRAQIDFHGQVELDVRYIETRTFWSDLRILARTVPAVLSGTGAY